MRSCSSHITGVDYKGIKITRRITCNTNLILTEIQGIKITWRSKPVNIYNMYYPPASRNLSNNLKIFYEDCICVGDLKPNLGLYQKKI